MGKGSKRRPEDRAAVARNWPLGTTHRPRQQVPVVVKCYFCRQPIPHCDACGRDHCPCTPIGNCRDLRPLRGKKAGDPLNTNPYGFVQHRSGFAGGMSHE